MSGSPGPGRYLSYRFGTNYFFCIFLVSTTMAFTPNIRSLPQVVHYPHQVYPKLCSLGPCGGRGLDLCGPVRSGPMVQGILILHFVFHILLPCNMPPFHFSRGVRPFGLSRSCRLCHSLVIYSALGGALRSVLLVRLLSPDALLVRVCPWALRLARCWGFALLCSTMGLFVLVPIPFCLCPGNAAPCW